MVLLIFCTAQSHLASSIKDLLLWIVFCFTMIYLFNIFFLTLVHLIVKFSLLFFFCSLFYFYCDRCVAFPCIFIYLLRIDGLLTAYNNKNLQWDKAKHNSYKNVHAQYFRFAHWPSFVDSKSMLACQIFWPICLPVLLLRTSSLCLSLTAVCFSRSKLLGYVCCLKSWASILGRYEPIISCLAAFIC